MNHTEPQRSGSLRGNGQRWNQAPLMPTIILCLGACLLLPCLGIVPIALFPEETIEVFVHNGSIEVQATYIYKNPWSFPIEQGFSVPLPVDANHPMPAPLILTRINNGEPVLIREWLTCRTFELHFQPKESVPVQLYYRQETPTRTATYILTSTRAWKRPLERAVYRLHCDEPQTIKSNYPLERCGKSDWCWKRTNFMPERDWQISWSN